MGEHADERVLVTGASGFIATHIVQQLQQAGYRVRGTVRSLGNDQKVKPLRELCPDAKYALELVEADLTKDDGWKEAVEDCKFVLHTASPFPNENPSNEMEVITPAVEGTLRVFRACRGRAVRRVVLTSSVAALSTGTTSGTVSEQDWTDVDKTNLAYYKSKTLAERAAWDFVEELQDTEKFELAVVNPAYVMGPILCGGWATSMEVPKRLLERAMPALPRINMSFVDVRDVAAGHIAAMLEPEAAGHRHILSSHSLWMREIALVYDEEFKGLGYCVPTSQAPYFVVKFMSFFDKTVRLILPGWNQLVHFDNSRMKNVLKIQPREAKETLLDMAYTMIERGLIKQTRKYQQMKDKI